MAKGPSCLTENDLTPYENEGFGDNEVDEDGDDDKYSTLSGDESVAPSRSVVRKVSQTISFKRKSEETIDSLELKRRLIIHLLKSCIGSSSGPSMAQRVRDVLVKMEVSEKMGHEYFVSAIRCLREEKCADSLLALGNDNHRWLYLKKKGSP